MRGELALEHSLVKNDVINHASQTGFTWKFHIVIYLKNHYTAFVPYVLILNHGQSYVYMDNF